MTDTHLTCTPAQPSPQRPNSEPVKLGDLLPDVLAEMRRPISGRPTYYCNLIERTHYLYRVYSGEKLLYVGVSIDPQARMEKHRLKPWWRNVTDVKVVRCESREAALSAERAAIIAENPTHNIARPKVR